MEYEINKAALPLGVVRSSLDLLIQRKSHNRFLPSHIDPEDAEEYWQNLRFGTRHSGDLTKEGPFSMEASDLAHALNSLAGERKDSDETSRVEETDELRRVREKLKIAKPPSELRFSSPSAAVQRYREMSRQGRREYEKMKEAEKGMPKILLGHGVYTGEKGLGNEGPSVTQTATEKIPTPSFFSKLFGGRSGC